MFLLNNGMKSYTLWLMEKAILDINLFPLDEALYWVRVNLKDPNKALARFKEELLRFVGGRKQWDALSHEKAAVAVAGTIRHRLTSYETEIKQQDRKPYDDPCDRVLDWNAFIDQVYTMVEDFIERVLPDSFRPRAHVANQQWRKSHLRAVDPRCQDDGVQRPPLNRPAQSPAKTRLPRPGSM